MKMMIEVTDYLCYILVVIVEVPVYGLNRRFT